MSFHDDLKKAQQQRATETVDISLAGNLYSIEISRLPGMQWAAIIAAAPPQDAADARLGYSPATAALAACKAHGRLLDAAGVPVADVDWGELFDAISGVEVQAVAAVWWGLNMGTPNDEVVALKKVSRPGSKTS
ncbi:hypothetical protein [Canibacter oris]|uniref:Uncharacterized protein n=1 Tax=Canibacter oris TaxID=1365628 RepID=A0A840DK03_9MICO|nr:hypothetical protein [Canibacter oris]MBB4072045.1 hypothetical protein [Canibacter oris]